MWVDWVRRSYDHGLRVMVTLAVSNVTLATVIDGEKPYDDHSTGRLQIEETKRWIQSNGEWMEAVLNAQDLRRVVGSGKLAVVLGIELDDFLRPEASKNTAISERAIREAVREWYDLGVRYFFPIHIIDNLLGGTAVYETEFALAGRHQSGDWWTLGCANREDGITWRYRPESDFLKEILIARNLDIGFGDGPHVPKCSGHVNRCGLNRLGKVALDEAMALGMLIDIDHMSQRAVEATLALAEEHSYPIVSGHNSPRSQGKTENSRTKEHYRRISALGGMAGVGWSGRDVASFAAALRSTADEMGGRGLAIGSDANGLVPLPGRPDSPIPNVEVFQTGQKFWNYNNDGVAHYGLIPEFLRHAAIIGADEEVELLSKGAEDFALMWERAETARSRILFSREPTFGVWTEPVKKGWFCPTKILRGDGEFAGNGPRMKARASVHISPSRKELIAKIYFHAKETRDDWSETEGEWETVVWKSAVPIKRILSSQTAESDSLISSRAGGQFLTPSHSNAVKRTCHDEGLVRYFEMVGDTGGNDISGDNDCKDDTRIRVTFNPIHLEVEGGDASWFVPVEAAAAP